MGSQVSDTVRIVAGSQHGWKVVRGKRRPHLSGGNRSMDYQRRNPRGSLKRKKELDMERPHGNTKCFTIQMPEDFHFYEELL
jgi:hypothetical protein